MHIRLLSLTLSYQSIYCKNNFLGINYINYAITVKLTHIAHVIYTYIYISFNKIVKPPFSRRLRTGKRRTSGSRETSANCARSFQQRDYPSHLSALRSKLRRGPVVNADARSSLSRSLFTAATTAACHAFKSGTTITSVRSSVTAANRNNKTHRSGIN